MSEPCFFCGTPTVREPGSEPVCVECRAGDEVVSQRIEGTDITLILQGWKKPAVIIAPDPSYTGWSSVTNCLFVRRPLLALGSGV